MSATSQTAIGAVAATPARRDFRIPLGPRLFSLFGVVMLGGVTGFFAVFAILLVRMNVGLSLFFAAAACLMGVLTCGATLPANGDCMSCSTPTPLRSTCRRDVR